MKHLKECSTPHCTRPQYMRGLCDVHYTGFHRSGNVGKRRSASVPTYSDTAPMPCPVFGFDRASALQLPTATMDTFHRRMDIAAFERAQWENERDAEYDRQVRLWRGEQEVA